MKIHVDKHLRRLDDGGTALLSLLLAAAKDTDREGATKASAAHPRPTIAAETMAAARILLVLENRLELQSSGILWPLAMTLSAPQNRATMHRPKDDDDALTACCEHDAAKENGVGGGQGRMSQISPDLTSYGLHTLMLQ